MKIASIVTLVSLLGLLVGTSLNVPQVEANGGSPEVSGSVNVTLFGPQQYVRTAGQPDVSVKLFPGTEGEGILRIINGDDTGARRVSSALITVNGDTVLTTSDFSQRMGTMEIRVQLTSSNSIIVELRGKPRSYLAVQVTQEIEAEAAAVVGSDGGMIQVTNPDSPIHGARMVIPEGAVDEDIVFSLGEGTTVGDPALIGIPVSVGPEGYVFNKEVELTMPLTEPFPSEDLLMLVVYTEASESYEYAGRLVEVHTGATELTVSIGHFSSFLFMRTAAYFAGLPSVISLVPTLLSVGSAVEAGDSSELDILKQVLMERRSHYDGIMTAYSEAHGWCSDVFGLADFKEKASDEIYGHIASSGLAYLLGVSASTAGVATVLMIPALAYWGLADVCFLFTSWANPSFLDAWAGYSVSELGIGIIDKALAGAEISYDDGSAEYGWATGGDIGGVVVRFTPPTIPWTLASIRVMAWYQGDDAPFFVEIWDENRNELFAGTYMYSDHFNTWLTWAEIDMPDIGVTGDFYVCVFPNDALPDRALWMAFDNDSPYSGRSHTGIYTTNVIDFDNEWDWMIRAVGRP